MPTRVRTNFFANGYCRHLLRLVDGKTWKVGRFHAVFLAVEHPTHGLALVDTGYSDRFRAASRRWPHCLYRWASPAVDPLSTSACLRSAGFDPEAVRSVILSHFHADHVGGVRDFPHARFYYHQNALSVFEARSAWGQTRSAFLPELLPQDFKTRSLPLQASYFSPCSWSPALSGYDLFGDGSIVLISLPGHAPGHCGVYLQDQDGPILYAADAFWHHHELDEAVAPAWLARLFLDDNSAYRSTVSILRDLRGRSDLRLLACHCPQTQALVSNLPRHA
ncbi:MAG TPA: MBL fold metallo-hydrolase [Opitutaceae bacterium]|nr:MBL fold metallo-hydrolase [Opitutaceae bacterium]